MRPFTVIDCQQRTPAWEAARAGRVTGTCADAVMTTKGRKAGEPSVVRRDLKIRKALERLTGVPIEEDGASRRSWVRRGAEVEAEARVAYEMQTGTLVRLTGFIAHNDLPIGCSLDGDVDDFTGIVSLKCPKSATHLSYLQDPSLIFKEHRHQALHELLVTGAEWYDLVSYDPRYPDEGRLVIVRHYRGLLAPELDAYELMLRQFLKEVDAEFAAVQTLLQRKAVA